MREKEGQGAILSKVEKEAVVFMGYLESYMEKFTSRLVSFEVAQLELVEKRPATFIIQRLREETYLQNKPYFDKMKGKSTILENQELRIDL